MNYSRLALVFALAAFVLVLRAQKAEARCTWDEACEGFSQYQCLAECQTCASAGFSSFCWGGKCSWAGIEWMYVKTDSNGEPGSECYVCASNYSAECPYE